MQEQGDRPARPGRPSLISSAPDTETGPQGILSSLDGKSGAKVARPAAAPAREKSRPLVWGVLGLGIVAVVAGMIALGTDDGPRETAPMLAAAAPPAAMPAPASPAASSAAGASAASASAIAPEPEPSAAAVLQDAPEVAAATPPAPAEAAPFKSITGAAGNKDPLSQALERPAKDTVAKSAHHADKPRADDKKGGEKKVNEKKVSETRLAQARTPQKPAVKAEPKPADNDVVLLAALMAHMQPRNRKATPAEQLKICRQYNAAGEEQCRARLCEGDARKEPECKARRIMKESSDT
ncbi:hypothetical protein IP91_00270 [Pseudoduganella lurida]|uniref:Uncharacterized protein n=1 Tax=Pseudoduganella lurida TaxID=1036180 RepID=A0A562RKS8_9BURK|nr:hypothetical protein [Pseudoduganella lurida]TWI69204.1 hypothetical protein IP91_00270 [Pseudoduganella lurida]